MSDQRYFYINTIDILDERKIMGVAIIFNLQPPPRSINKDGTIHGDYFEFTHFSSGVMIDQELAEFWSKHLKKKNIRSFFRHKPFTKRKQKVFA